MHNSHVPGEPGLAGFTAAKDDGNGGDNRSYKTYKTPVRSSPPTNHHPTCYRPDVVPDAQPTMSKHLLLLLSCAKSHMLSASRPHLLHVSAVDRHQTWSMDKS